MIQWILEHLGIVIVIVAFIAQMVRGVMQQSRKTSRREFQPGDGDEERRVREVQEQIRRQIAARRGEATHTEAPPVLRPEQPAPIPRAETTQMPEPFGGPFGRMLEELQRKAQQHLPPPPPPVVVERRHQGELERQQRLADELKAVEEARHVVERRAAHKAADKQAVADAEPALRTGARQRLLRDLGDVENLRRAFVLKEVLGPPVGLR